MKKGNQKPRKNRNLNKKPNAFDQAMNNVNIIIIMRELFTGIQPLQSIYQQSTEDLIIVPEEKANAINLNHVKVEGSTDDRSQKLKGRGKLRRRVGMIMFPAYSAGNQEMLHRIDRKK